MPTPSNASAPALAHTSQELPDDALLRWINGEVFAVIVYDNDGAHAPTVTSYPVRNLPGLKSRWRFATLAEFERLTAQNAALLAALESANTELYLFQALLNEQWLDAKPSYRKEIELSLSKLAAKIKSADALLAQSRTP